MAKKRGLNETLESVDEIVISTSDETEVQENGEENPAYESLLSSAQEVRKREGVIGYILKGDSKATVDLNDSQKIVEYALFSSQIFESSQGISEAFNLGEFHNIVIEGRNLKAICLNKAENKLSVFLEKTSPHDWVLDAFA